MSIISNIVATSKTAFAKAKAQLIENKADTSPNGKRVQKAVLVYLGSQTVDPNLHPLSRMYAGTLLPFITRGMTPRKKILAALAGTAWMFSKNKKAGFIKSICMTTIAISSVKPSLEEEISEALGEAHKNYIDRLNYKPLEKHPQLSLEEKRASY